jgi:hypothetical protein
MAADGTQLTTAGGRMQDGRFVFRYAAIVNGQAVAEYRITVSG